MKTIPQLKSLVTDIKHQIETEDLKKAAENRLRKKIKTINECIMILENNPTPQFIKSEIEKVRAKIDRRMGLFIFDETLSLPKTTITKMRAAHKKEYGVNQLEFQENALTFLLK